MTWPIRTALIATALTAAALLAPAPCAQAQPVQLTDDLSFFDLRYAGETIRVERNQDNSARLTGDFAKTSRACPPFCIQPMTAAPGVETFGEIEVLRFLNQRVQTGTGALIDARIEEWHVKGTLPGAINLPFTLLTETKGGYLDQALTTLGARQNGGAWDFSDALPLVLFCNGPWCDQSSRAITALIAAGYPADKLKYYRGGMQSWQLMGLTVAAPLGSGPEEIAGAVRITGTRASDATTRQLRDRVAALVADAGAATRGEDDYSGALLEEAARGAEALPEAEEQEEAQEQAAAGAGDRFLIVQPGDTLSLMAERFYGNRLQFRKIYDANRDQLDNPNNLPLGVRLRIPE